MEAFRSGIDVVVVVFIDADRTSPPMKSIRGNMLTSWWSARTKSTHTHTHTYHSPFTALAATSVAASSCHQRAAHVDESCGLVARLVSSCAHASVSLCVIFMNRIAFIPCETHTCANRPHTRASCAILDLWCARSSLPSERERERERIAYTTQIACAATENDALFASRPPAWATSEQVRVRMCVSVVCDHVRALVRLSAHYHRHSNVSAGRSMLRWCSNQTRPQRSSPSFRRTCLCVHSLASHVSRFVSVPLAASSFACPPGRLFAIAIHFVQIGLIDRCHTVRVEQ